MRFLLPLVILVIACSSPEDVMLPAPVEVPAQAPSSPTPPSTKSASSIRWQDWSTGLFEQARQENRLVLLDLGAVWCHWCHVMDEKTYRDPKVASIIAVSFLPVRVDQDSRPDLASRYQAYGWPATILFDGQGRELAKLSGFIPPQRFRSLLEAFVLDPTPGPSVLAPRVPQAAPPGPLPQGLKERAIEELFAAYDSKHEGWGGVHKFLDWDCVEASLELSREAQKPARTRRLLRMAQKTCEAQLQLIDPVWGGVYQYSHGGIWSNPHYEKIMRHQAENLRLFSLAAVIFTEPRFRAAAAAIRGYLRDFLTSPEGAFYASQDADLVPGQHAAGYFALGNARRRALGIPRIDQHRYARESGWAIRALAVDAALSGSAEAKAAAEAGARWLVAHRRIKSGGFGHAAAKEDQLYLEDNIAVAQGLFELHQLSAEPRWLLLARETVDLIDRRFRHPKAGYQTRPSGSAAAAVGVFSEGVVTRDDNLALARLGRRLASLTGEDRYLELARRAFRSQASPDSVLQSRSGAILLADRALAREPLHISIVGRRADSAARALHRAALALGTMNKVVEWVDGERLRASATGLTPGIGKEAAAYLCAAGRCSAPVRKPAQLAAAATILGQPLPRPSKAAEESQ